MYDIYEWLDKNFLALLVSLDLKNYIPSYESIITADADNCIGYREQWNEHNIPYEHGVALYLLTKCHPFTEQVRQTKEGWVAPVDWVRDNYIDFKEYLPTV